MSDATEYDLDLQFFVEVNDKTQSDTLWNIVKEDTFFDEYKAALVQSLTMEWVTTNYNVSLISDFSQQIESMQVDENLENNVDITSPTFSPTSNPTYDYEEGEAYGQSMVAIGIIMIVAFLAYCVYLRYKKIQTQKKEIRTDKEGTSIEFQSLFDAEHS